MHYTRQQGNPAYAYQLSQPSHRDCAHCDDVTDKTRPEHVLTHSNTNNLLFTTSIISRRQLLLSSTITTT